MIINILKLSDDNQSIQVSVETREGDVIQSALLWTDKTFKNYDEAINLSEYLAGSTNKEVFSIDINSLEIQDDNKLFFIEFSSTDNGDVGGCSTCEENTLMGVTADFSKYREFILDKILNFHYDKNCTISVQEQSKIVNLEMILKAICTSISFGYYNEAISLLSDLNKLAVDDLGCDSCDALSYPSVRTTLTFGILNNNLILA